LKGTWYLDTLIAKVKLLLSNMCANMFTNGKYTKVVPMVSWKEAAESLNWFYRWCWYPGDTGNGWHNWIYW
jgi:hypothetical protein